MGNTGKNLAENEAVNEQGSLPYKHCLNCGAELKGLYCHSCGQEAVDKTPTVGGFVMEYLNNAFIWDSQFLKTFWTLICRPGRLTTEYLSGKFISQEHPLKLNMFLLFVFITLFVFFASAEKMTNSVHTITKDEMVFPAVQLQLLMNDVGYVEKMQESPRDTILLQAPLFLAENYTSIVSNIETIEDTKGEALDKWRAVVPRVLLDEELVVIDSDGYYRFNTEAKVGDNDLELFNTVWAELVRIASQYFPMLLLLTAPFLSFSLSLVQRRSRLPRINHFIFALHYTALLETLIILIYIFYLTVAPPMGILESILIIGSCVYLTIAFRRVYAVSSWWKAIVKSLLTSLVYLIILMMIFMAVFIAACYVTATQLE